MYALLILSAAQLARLFALPRRCSAGSCLRVRPQIRGDGGWCAHVFLFCAFVVKCGVAVVFALCFCDVCAAYACATMHPHALLWSCLWFLSPLPSSSLSLLLSFLLFPRPSLSSPLLSSPLSPSLTRTKGGEVVPFAHVTVAPHDLVPWAEWWAIGACLRSKRVGCRACFGKIPLWLDLCLSIRICAVLVVMVLVGLF